MNKMRTYDVTYRTAGSDFRLHRVTALYWADSAALAMNTGKGVPSTGLIEFKDSDHKIVFAVPSALLISIEAGPEQPDFIAKVKRGEVSIDGARQELGYEPFGLPETQVPWRQAGMVKLVQEDADGNCSAELLTPPDGGTYWVKS